MAALPPLLAFLTALMSLQRGPHCSLVGADALIGPKADGMDMSVFSDRSDIIPRGAMWASPPCEAACCPFVGADAFIGRQFYTAYSSTHRKCSRLPMSTKIWNTECIHFFLLPTP